MLPAQRIQQLCAPGRRHLDGGDVLVASRQPLPARGARGEAGHGPHLAIVGKPQGGGGGALGLRAAGVEVQRGAAGGVRDDDERIEAGGKQLRVGAGAGEVKPAGGCQQAGRRGLSRPSAGCVGLERPAGAQASPRGVRQEGGAAGAAALPGAVREDRQKLTRWRCLLC